MRRLATFAVAAALFAGLSAPAAAAGFTVTIKGMKFLVASSAHDDICQIHRGMKGAVTAR